MNDRARRRLGSTVMFLIPLVAVGVVALTSGGPQVADGAGPAPAPVAAPTVVPPTIVVADPAFVAAGEYAVGLRARSIVGSPFFYPSEVQEAAPVVIFAPTGPPKFKVNGIMASPRGNIVLIDGSAHRSGDTILGTEWQVLDIDPVTRSLQIVGPDGEIETRSVK